MREIKKPDRESGEFYDLPAICSLASSAMSRRKFAESFGQAAMTAAMSASAIGESASTAPDFAARDSADVAKLLSAEGVAIIDSNPSPSAFPLLKFVAPARRDSDPLVPAHKL